MSRPRIPTDRLIAHIKVQMLAGVYSPDSRLPSIRCLAERFGLKYNTARLALLQLAAAGLLRQERTGFIIHPWRPEGKPDGIPIAIIGQAPRSMATLYHETLLGMVDIARLHNYHFLIYRLERFETTAERLAALCRNTAGAVLLNSYDAVIPELKLPVPAVGVMLGPAAARHISVINIDPIQMAARAVGFFRQRHVERVRLYRAPREVFRCRTAAFAAAFTAAGGCIAGEEVTDQPILLHAEARTGYFFASDALAHLALKSFREYTGQWLPDLRPVLSVDGKRLLHPEFGRFATLAYDWQAMGRLALAELGRLIETPNAPKRELCQSGKIIL